MDLQMSEEKWIYYNFFFTIYSDDTKAAAL